MQIQEEVHNRLRQVHNPEGSELRKAQYYMLDLLKFLDKVCLENNLRYWLAGGTLLGAARHDGFIPWDDDVDVYMPREDAKKLKNLMGDKIHNGFAVLQNLSTDPNYLCSSWMTLRHTKSEYVSNELWFNRQKYKGLQVDIFIVDEGVNMKIKKPITWLHQQLVFRPFVGRKMKYFRWMVNFNHKVFDNIIFPFLRLFKFNDKLTVGYGCIFSFPTEKKFIYPLKRIKFEDSEFNCPNDPETLLTNQYGDWRKIPESQNQRTDHNISVRFLD